jgi:hypothetical protein
VRDLTFKPVALDTARVYRLATEEGPGWANITIREWPRGGSIDVQSDYGNYAYSWTAIGPGTLRAFLLSLDFGYFMGKAHAGYMEYDGDASRRALVDEVIAARKQGDLSRADARHAYDAISLADFGSEESFWHHVQTSLYTLYNWAGDAPIRHSPSAQSLAFWELVWPVVCAFWRDELKAEAA